MKKLLLLLLCGSLNAATYYVAPSGGNDSNPGSYASPYATIAKGVSMVGPGDTLVLKNGTYNQRLIAYAKHGSAVNPITIQAETDYGVTLTGPVSSGWPQAQVLIRRSSYITLEGVRVQDPTGFCYWVMASTNCTLRRLVGRRPENTLASWNNHVFSISFEDVGGTFWHANNNLLEDSMALEFHRHGVYLGDYARTNTVRRVYLNSFGRTRVDGYVAQEAANYGASYNVWENNFFAQSDYTGFTVNGVGSGGSYNRYYGCIVTAFSYSGGQINARVDSPSEGFSHDNVFQDVVAIDTGRNGIKATQNALGIGNGHDNRITNSFSLSVSKAAYRFGPNSFFWSSGFAYPDIDLLSATMSASVHNSVAVNSAIGYSVEEDTYRNTNFLGSFTVYSTNNTASGCISGQTIESDPAIILLQSGYLTSNPGYDTAKFGNGAYLMRAPNQPTRGASVIHRYVDGVLTTTPLWPWATDAQITAEIGLTATYEASGGIWKTLDGVYAEAPATLTVAISIVDSDTIFEGGDTSTVRISRYLDGEPTTSGNLASTLTVSGTASSGIHYDAISANWQIDAGQSYEDITVTTTATDASWDGDLTIILTLDADAAYTITTPSVTLNRIDATYNVSIPRDPALPGSARRAPPL